MPIRYELRDGKLVTVEDDAPRATTRESLTPDGEGGFLSRVVKMPGAGESLASLPASFLGLFPPAKPFTIPAAGFLGSLGEAVEEAGQGRFDARDIGAAGLRQAGLEAAGGLLTKAARPVMSVFGMPGAKTAAVKGALENRVVTGSGAARAATATRSAVDDLARTMRPVPMHEITNVMRDTARREVAGSATPRSTARQMLTDIHRVERENPATLAAEQVLTKKRQAGRGFETRQAAHVEGRPTTIGTEMREGFRSGAQRALEDRSPRYRPLSDQAGRAAETRRYFFKRAQQPDSSLYLGLTGLVRGQPALQVPARLAALFLQDLGRATPTLSRALPLLPSHD